MSKGQFTYDALMWFTKIFFLALVVVINIGLIKAFAMQEVNSDTVEAALLVEALHHSPLLAYQDNLTQRTYYPLLDREKIANKNFSEEITSERKNVAVRMTLTQNGTVREDRFYIAGRPDTEEQYQVFVSLKRDPNRVHVYKAEKEVLLKETIGTSLATMTYEVITEK